MLTPSPLLFFFPRSLSTLSSFLYISSSPLSYPAHSTFLLNVNWCKYVVNEEFSHLGNGAQTIRPFSVPSEVRMRHMDNGAMSLNKRGRCEK